jgi:hypothetical protein
MKAQLILLAAAVIVINTAWMAPVKPESSTANAPVKVNEAKLNPTFSFTRAHRQGKNIVATWAISSNEGVLGFSVQKTYEDPTDPYAFWEDLCTVACNPVRSYKHTDTNVFPGYVHYRIVAQMSNGSSVVSETATVRIVSQ